MCLPVSYNLQVHSLANGPEVTKPLLETSRKVSLVAKAETQLASRRSWELGLLVVIGSAAVLGGQATTYGLP